MTIFLADTWTIFAPMTLQSSIRRGPVGLGVGDLHEHHFQKNTFCLTSLRTLITSSFLFRCFSIWSMVLWSPVETIVILEISFRSVTPTAQTVDVKSPSGEKSRDLGQNAVFIFYQYGKNPFHAVVPPYLVLLALSTRQTMMQARSQAKNPSRTWSRSSLLLQEKYSISYASAILS